MLQSGGLVGNVIISHAKGKKPAGLWSRTKVLQQMGKADNNHARCSGVGTAVDSMRNRGTVCGTTARWWYRGMYFYRVRVDTDADAEKRSGLISVAW